MKNINDFMNEAKRDTHDLVSWMNSTDNNLRLSDDMLVTLENQIREYIVADDPFSDINLPGISKELVTDIAGYIIEVYLYDLTSRSMSVLLSKNFEEFENVDLTKIKPTRLAGRGLINPETNQPIFWDFSFNGLSDKFEIKSLCKNSYHTGGFTKSNNLKSDTNVVYITCKYNASNTGFTIDPKSIKVTRN